MKYSTVLSLGALALPAIASPIVAPVLGAVGGLVANVVGIVTAVETLPNLLEDCKTVSPIDIELELELEIAGLIEVEAEVDVEVGKRHADHVVTSAQDIIHICADLLVQIKVFTGAINQTVASVPAGTECTDADVAFITVQLNLAVDAIKAVALAIGAVGGLLKCTVEEVATIISIVIAIVLELVCTLVFVVKTLNIQVLLTAILANVAKILACLILILDHVVGGVLVSVLACINVGAILELVTCVVASLLQFLLAGKILVI